MTEQTSIEAYNAVKPVRAPSLRIEVLDALQKEFFVSGATVEELEKFLGTRENSIRPRLTELKELGFAGERGTRVNSRGRNQKVWVAALAA